MYKLVQHYHPNSILELGTSVGYGTFHLAYNNVNSSIISVDACSNTQNIAKSALEKFHLQNIEYSNDTFSNFFSQYSGNLFDLVFVDGHHDGKALLKYMQDLDPFTHNNTLFLLDDIRWSEGMKAAWNELVQMEKYHVSIDLFRMGIVIKRPQQAKEHFTIRY